MHIVRSQNQVHVFKSKSDISILNGGSLKLEDKFIYLESSVSSTENYINMWLAKPGLLSIGCRLYGNQTYPIKFYYVDTTL